MYFNLSGKIDVSLILVKSNKKAKAEELARQIIESGLEYEGNLLNSAVEKMKEHEKYYIEMHPKMTLNEDYIEDNISIKEIHQLFQRFFVPLRADICCLTIVDQYIFANGTNVTLLTDILKTEATSKQIRFITKSSNVDATTKNNVETILKADGFNVDINYSNQLHDRWWYTRINGFTTGISFNGLRRKESTIKMLDQSELSKIISNHGF